MNRHNQAQRRVGQSKSGDEKRRAALKAYGAKFGNLDMVMMPELMGHPRLVEFLRECVASGKPATRKTIEARFGPVAWDW